MPLRTLIIIYLTSYLSAITNMYTVEVYISVLSNLKIKIQEWMDNQTLVLISHRLINNMKLLIERRHTPT